MDEISIKVTIGSREYPLKVNRADEERVMKAAQLIGERLREYEKQYPVSDKYDHLAMCVMHFAGEMVSHAADRAAEQQDMINSIRDIDSAISNHLSGINVH
jgi:hypothetical protein